MPIAKMKRLQVLALERDHDALLRQLERMGCVEISEPDAPDAPESLRRCDSETADCLSYTLSDGTMTWTDAQGELSSQLTEEEQELLRVPLTWTKQEESK